MKHKYENTFSRNIALALALMMIMAMIFLSPDERIQLALSTGTRSSGWTSSITYMMVHANWFHLAINLYALLALVFLSNANAAQILASILLSAMLPSVLIGDIPILGFSVVNYTLTGLLIISSSRFWWLFSINALLLGSQVVVPGIAVVAHAWGFVTGAVFGYCYNFIFKPRFNE